ncbi:HmuY family protein [Mesonia aestuariivivens]|uniref:HmuY family protein n=1 Tax=Mesonia aestuariivivens TaxID=2796128 RepID=A0ABS6W2N4_9FLAO|nr:HmuY family protein [Mesonia aestuariivivens]MBW2961802.1 HmuY family protein [Mesonia aestuariivivens]
MNYKFQLLSLLFVLCFTSCSDDDKDTGISNDFVVAFEKQSISFSSEETSSAINLVYSEEASENGTISIIYTETNVSYSTDFTTSPAAESGVIEIPIEAGTIGTSFEFEKLTPNPTEGEAEKKVEFEISAISLPNAFTQGNTKLLVSYNESASLGGSFSPSVGGPNEGNQVYIDLSSQTEKIISRDKWDLAFYSGEEFRVKINSALLMMAAQLETTNIDNVAAGQVSELQTQMQFLQAGSDAFVDAPSGDITETVINEISTTLEENKVYLLNMGSEIGTTEPDGPGSVAVGGDERGWMKIRILQENGEYILQYADLEATTHQEINIQKTPGYNFTFFSLITENIVNVEPAKEKWDLNFTVFTEVLDLPDEDAMTAYGYSDYVATNVLAETKTYQVNTSEITYSDFNLTNLDEASFEIDQRTIGSSWRNTIPPNRYIFNDIFYVVEDPEGNIYKLRFTAMMNENGVRGYPEFEYSLLN